MLKYLKDNYSHADALVTVAVLMICYLAWRSATVDLAGFGEGIAGILGGRGLHAWGTAQGNNS